MIKKKLVCLIRYFLYFSLFLSYVVLQLFRRFPDETDNRNKITDMNIYNTDKFNSEQLYGKNYSGEQVSYIQ